MIESFVIHASISLKSAEGIWKYTFSHVFSIPLIFLGLKHCIASMFRSQSYIQHVQSPFNPSFYNNTHPSTIHHIAIYILRFLRIALIPGLSTTSEQQRPHHGRIYQLQLFYSRNSLRLDQTSFDASTPPIPPCNPARLNQTNNLNFSPNAQHAMLAWVCSRRFAVPAYC